MSGTWRAHACAAWAGRGVRILFVASLLGGCSSSDDGASGGNYPDLNTVPQKPPATSDSTQRQQVAQGLASDQKNAAYSDQSLTAQPSSGVAPPPPAQPAPAAPAETPAAAAPAAPAATQTASAPAMPQPAAPPATAEGATPMAPPPNPTPTAPTASAPTASAPTATAASSPSVSVDQTQLAPDQAVAYQQALAAQGVTPGPTALSGPTYAAPAYAAPGVTPGYGTQALVGTGRPVAVIFFSSGSAALSERDLTVLQNVLLVQQQQGGRLRVVGNASEYTAAVDYQKHQQVNYDLSLRRAQAVSRALIRLGAPDGSVAIAANGAQSPIFYEFTPTGEAGNRRVEIFLDR
jgi:outer membrane protein OmpA-like peptidoglycan-associated protein